MDTEILIKYIKSGVLSDTFVGNLAWHFGTGIVTLLGLLMGFLVGGICKYICLTMIALFTVSLLMIVGLSLIGLNTKLKLIISSIIGVDLMCQFIGLLAIVYYFVFGINFYIALIYLPIIISIVILFVKFARIEYYKPSPNDNPSSNKIFVPSVLSSISTGVIVKLFNDSLGENSSTIMGIILLIILILLASIFSIFLFGIQRLYCLSKYTKLGLITEEMMEMETVNS